ncbi:hypothetical protein [Hydrogenimonas urashimensis]|uniref:hypothetical protein n=1 Tax=Hydrogenimonas urashimensis TaxID=2740515 RepID=UPI00191677AF|nr:hypothetical protein [Hydrogenimonas urashimensis]
MLYVAAALLFLLFGLLLYRAYARERDVSMALKGAAMIGAGFFFIAIVRSMIVYKPLMILHIAAVFLYGYGVVRYLLARETRIVLLAAPLVSILLFFVTAWFFREV